MAAVSTGVLPSGSLSVTAKRKTIFKYRMIKAHSQKFKYSTVGIYNFVVVV